jgi:hypothetical protein
MGKINIPLHNTSPKQFFLTHIVSNFNIKCFIWVLNKLKVKKGEGTTFIHTYLKSYF